MKVSAVVLVVVLVACVAVSSVSAYKWGEQGPKCKVANDCVEEKNKPLCRQIDPEDEDDKKCVECDFADGDSATCPPGYWCVVAKMGADEEYGYKEEALPFTCQKKKKPLGEFCASAVNGSSVRKGESDQAFCGYVSKWCGKDDDADECIGKAEDAAAILQWTGACVDNKCYECQADQQPFAGYQTPFIAADKGCYTSESAGVGGSQMKYRASGAIVSANQSAPVQMLIAIDFLASIMMVGLCYKCLTG